jgi:YbgC/YbaW family acyl-CoA thioester hydrolase
VEAQAQAPTRARTKEGFAFRHALQVRFRDCDPMRHANNAVYFTYLEQARFAYWREVIRIPHSETRSFILARAECDYRSAAVPGEWLDVWIRTSSIGRSSFVFEYEVVSGDDGRLVATARSVQVMFDYVANRSLPVADDLVATLERFEGRTLRAAEA